jgi:arsenate reductase-like glutaredoxin family protein
MQTCNRCGYSTTNRGSFFSHVRKPPKYCLEMEFVQSRKQSNINKDTNEVQIIEKPMDAEDFPTVAEELKSSTESIMDEMCARVKTLKRLQMDDAMRVHTAKALLDDIPLIKNNDALIKRLSDDNFKRRQANEVKYQNRLNVLKTEFSSLSTTPFHGVIADAILSMPRRDLKNEINVLRVLLSIGEARFDYISLDVSEDTDVRIFVENYLKSKVTEIENSVDA